MKLELKAKTSIGEDALKEVLKEGKKSMSRMAFKVEKLEDNPLTVLFKFTGLKAKALENKVIRNTLIQGLKEQLEIEYKATEKDYTIEVSECQ